MSERVKKCEMRQSACIIYVVMFQTLLMMFIPGYEICTMILCFLKRFLERMEIGNSKSNQLEQYKVQAILCPIQCIASSRYKNVGHSFIILKDKSCFVN